MTVKKNEIHCTEVTSGFSAISLKKLCFSRILQVLLKSLLFAIFTGIIAFFAHYISDRFIFHVHGRPGNEKVLLRIYASFEKFLMAIAFYLLGRKIPVKNPVLKAVVFVGLDWISNYIPQVMGLAFADGVIAEKAFSTSILFCDSLVYMLSGIVLGLIFYEQTETSCISCSAHSFFKAAAVSAFTFPALVAVFDFFMQFAFPAFSSIAVIQVSQELASVFRINFYSWFVVTGGFFTVFYRLTEFNCHGSFAYFSLIYGLLLWTPVVMFMVLFGTAFFPTLVYSLAFLGIILFVGFLNKLILCGDQKDVWLR